MHSGGREWKSKQKCFSRACLQGLWTYRSSRISKLVERANLQFRAEAFNLFNRVNLYNPAGDMGSQLFGQSTQAFGAREIQLSLETDVLN